MHGRRRYLRAVGAAATALVAGCRGGDTASTGRTTTATGTGTPTPTDLSPDGAGPLGDQLAKLAADDGEGSDNFGFSVALSADGSTAAVGALSDENADGELTGGAYVFTDDDDGDGWTQAAKLTAPDLPVGANFGRSVAIDGDGTTALVGAHGDTDDDGTRTGAAYLFEGAGGRWDRQPRLLAADGDGGDAFGFSVSLDRGGTTAVVGALSAENADGEAAGAAYVFGTDRDVWGQRAKLSAGSGDDDDDFGSAVAVSRDGERALVGASFDTDPNGYHAGSAYVFEAEGTDWRRVARLSPDDGDSGDAFGRAVALDGDGTTALVGANWDEDPNGRGGGSAYVFDDDGDGWTERDKLTDEHGGEGDGFGFSVALEDTGTVALVGATAVAPDGGDRTGAVSVFTTDGGAWRRAGTVSAADGDADDSFGSAVALDGAGATALVGAFNDEDPNGSGDGLEPGAGSAYVFE